MCKIILVVLTLVMVLATESKYSFIETAGVYGLYVRYKKDKINDESYPA